MSDFSNIQLADEKFNIPGEIQILLRAEIFYELLRPGQIYVPNSSLLLQNSVFGFLISGVIPSENESSVHCGLVQNTDNLEETIKKFWEVENVEPERVKNKETVICEEHYIKNYTRDAEGKYIVKMPLKEDPNTLGDSRDIALRKLNALWKRLKLDPVHLKLYKEFLSEYEDMGHMYEIRADEDEVGSYFIPHLSVYNPDKNCSKIRVVFNGSSLTTKSNSLNSLQYNGGVIQDDIFALMVRFRKHQFAFTADVEKMFRMIWIAPEQRKLQRILWKDEIDKPVKVYELATVTYGTVSAPYLAMRTLRQLALDEFENFPLAAPIVMSDTYMDDVLSGAESLEDAKEVQRQLTEIFKRGGMRLHKWSSNDIELNNTNKSDYTFLSPEDTKTLGVYWNPQSDLFSFKMIHDTTPVYTKRTVLSTIARIFDPLGLVGPTVTKAKIFIQSLWLLKLDWNKPLPAEAHREWEKLVNSLHSLNNIKIERCIIMKNSISVELHGFADSSEMAYGAVIYAKSLNSDGECKVKMIASKSRVAPIKKITVPRLELSAAVLLVKLMKRVKNALKLNITSVYYWSDSMIVLSWINKEALHLKTFVANRVTTIQEMSDVQEWRHVSSEENPADLVSRGAYPDHLFQCKLWWNGPHFLTMAEYPKKDIPIAVIVKDFRNELKKIEHCTMNFNISTHAFIYDFLSLSNNYVKLISILSFIFRFVRNCSREKRKKQGPISTEEMKNSESVLIKLIQGVEFRKEIKNLREGKSVPLDSQVRNLNAFLDEKGVMRVGGRIENSNLKTGVKFPIILPAKHKLTEIILEYFHKKYLHVGPQSLLYNVRQMFWPLNGRNACRKVVHNCIVCVKAKPVTCQQLMGNLPKERVSQDYPYNCSGVDFCGPFLIKYRNQRKGVYHKIYVAVFVCFVTKAVHLEMVTDLTSQAFIAALKRFFARRGKSSYLFSDNAKNFIGSDIEIKKLHDMVKAPDAQLAGYLVDEKVNWKFIPPRAPHFGGLWEAGVKSLKYHLKRVVGNQKLNYEDFLTVINQVEAILNSRPLTPLSADMDDLSVLTPGHFLIGRPITSLVEPNISEIEFNRLKLYQRITKIVQIFWKRWSNNYLNTLQQRTKWCFEKENFKLGDLVLLKTDDIGVGNWHLGRLIEVFPGKDGKIRVVMVKTKNGNFKRPITKLALLPIEN